MKKKRKSKITKMLGSFSKWTGGFIIGVVTIYGVYLQSPYYETYKKGKEIELLPKIEVLQGDLALDPFRSKNIELAYKITNKGKSRANNIEIQILVSGETSIHFIPDIFELSYVKEKKEYGDSINPKELDFKTVIYSSKLLDSNDFCVMYISMNKNKFERLNSLPKLNYNIKIVDSYLHFPNFTFIRYDEGQSVVKQKNQLMLKKKYISAGEDEVYGMDLFE